MKSIEQKEAIVLTYCKKCNQTLELPVAFEQAYLDSLEGRLCKFAVIHQGAVDESPHAILIDIDNNFTARRSEVTDLYIETTSKPPVEGFHVKGFCQLCQRELEIPINIDRFKEDIKTKGFYLKTFVHGQFPHAMVVLLDKSREIRRIDIVDLKSSIPITSSRKRMLKGKYDYIILEDLKKELFSTIFDAIFIFDRRSKTIIFFYTRNRRYDDLEIENLLETIYSAPKDLSYFLDIKNGSEYFFSLSKGKKVCTVGINMDKHLHSWLTQISKVIASEEGTPNTISLELLFHVMKRNGDIMDENTLQKLLFSPIYSLRMPWKYEEAIEDIFEELSIAFPKATSMFYPCALGWISILEALNTEEGIEQFEEFTNLINFVDRRGLL